VFIFHWLNSKSIREYIKSLATGAAQPDLNHDAFKSVKINLPPLQTQKRIASILSAYDDLIENNLKRIKLLEETAQNIYKEWFVNFCFPNYEHTPFNEETGLPEGWEMKKIEDCIKVMKGKKPKKEYTSVGENRVLYLLVDVLERRELRYTEIDNVQLTSEGETLMLMDGSRSGMVFKSLEGAIGSTLAVFRIKNNVFGIDYCFNFFKHRETEIISKNTGSAIPHANKNYINGMEIPIPTEKICNEFEAITNKIYKQIEFLSIQNQKLKEARDILLPRLMNRTIEV
jgi:type I restriction enzyme S subunit